MRAHRLQWSWAFSLVCEVALNVPFHTNRIKKKGPKTGCTVSKYCYLSFIRPHLGDFNDDENVVAVVVAMEVKAFLLSVCCQWQLTTYSLSKAGKTGSGANGWAPTRPSANMTHFKHKSCTSVYMGWTSTPGNFYIIGSHQKFGESVNCGFFNST